MSTIRSSARLLVSALGLLPSAALAAGLSIPDYGTAALGEGGAHVANPTDPTALYYNPAALADAGNQVLLDVRTLKHEVDFQRAANDQYPDGFDKVSNAGARLWAPGAAATFRLGSRWGFGIGVRPATGYGGYRFPDPRTIRPVGPDGKPRIGGTDDTEVELMAPQRYTQIQSDSLSLTPEIGVGFKAHPRLSLGAALQFPIYQLDSQQAIYANPFATGGETSSYDAILRINAGSGLLVSGAFGAQWWASDKLVLGASYQLPGSLEASGTLDAAVPLQLEALDAKVEGNKVKLSAKLPWTARLGARWVEPLWQAEVAGTYDAWSRYDKIHLAPEGVQFVLGTTVVPIPDIDLPKGMVDAFSVRVGGSILGAMLTPSLQPLTVRLGALYESSAVPADKTTVDLAHWERGVATAGLQWALGPVDLAASYAHFFQADRTVTDSTVRQAAPLEKIPEGGSSTAPVVGNGTYSSRLGIGTVAVTYHW